MAAQKENTRQKMINMMYLVFIAMLALNISKEVLGTLGILTDNIDKSTVTLNESIEDIYTDINANSSNDYFKIASEEVIKIKEITDNYFNYLQSLRDSLISLDENSYKKNVEYKDNDTNEDSDTLMVDYQVMDKSGDTDKLFFDGKVVLPEGKKFESLYSTFSQDINVILDSIISKDNSRMKKLAELDPDFDEPEFNFSGNIDEINNKFSYTKKVLNTEGNYQDWLEYNYKGFPLIASLAKFSNIQSDIRTVEYNILNTILNTISAKSGGLNVYNTLLETTGSYFTGDLVDAKIVVGRKDDSFKPKDENLSIDGIKLRKNIDYEIKEGGVVLKKRFTSAGEKLIEGTLYFEKDGVLDSLKVAQSVIVNNAPNKAIVSPINMQVFYVGLKNEIAVAFPGIADLSTIRATSNDGVITRQGDRYFAAPREGTESMSVIVSGKIDGETKTSIIPFDVKPEPPGKGSVFLVSGGVEKNIKSGDLIEKNELIYGLIRGEKPTGFVYDYDINVSAFQIKVGNLPTLTVQGNKVVNNNNAVSDVNAVGSGTAVTITITNATKIDGDIVSSTTVEKFTLTIR